MAAAKTKTTVHVVLDTNSLYTEAADKLLAQDISELIINSRESVDLDVHWYIPWIVKAERQFQMIERAKRLLPHLNKVERLLGHQLGITGDVLQTRVDEAINKQIASHDLKEISFDSKLVDWQKIVEQSVFRKPPFNNGEKEEGFRDAIVLESFCQLVTTLPKTAPLCRIVLLSDDSLLRTAAQERTADRNNATVINDIGKLKTMLNALAAELTQELVNSLLPKASIIFFEKDDENSLYYKADIHKEISELFGERLSRPPAPDFTVATKNILISSPPTFLAKKKQSLKFSSRITFQMEATKRVLRLGNSPLWGQLPPGLNPSEESEEPAPIYDLEDMLGNTSVSALSIDPISGSSFSGTESHIEDIKREGEHIFEATWSVTLTSRGALTGAKFLNVDHKSTKWRE